VRAASIVALLAGVGLSTGSLVAHAEPDLRSEVPRGTYVIVDRPAPQAGIDDHDGSHILFVNGCFGAGCTFTPGMDDSRTNRSSIPSSTSHIDPWPYGDAAWQQMMECVKDLYAPFNVIVTDVDPGSGTPHFETVVAGRPQDVGMPSGVGGVSPFTCGVIENAITFTFAAVIGNEPQIICEIVGQESAHAYGLDHEYLCEDPMTYLVNCGDKTFQDIDAPCGEYNARDCQCGGSTQNSVQRIKAIFGDAIPPTPPEVTIQSPGDSAEVYPGFTIEVDASDDVEVKRVEVLIGEEVIGTKTAPPYKFRAPIEYASMNATIEARAFDDRGTMGTDSVAVAIGDPCERDADCGEGLGCVDGRCVPFGVDGGLGEECTMDSECLSGICVEELGVCTELCDPDADSCPGNYDCVLVAGGGGACFEGESSGGCGCRIGQRDGVPLAPLGLGLLGVGLLLWRRRRAR